MNTKILKTFIYPFFVIVISILPLIVFVRVVLKIDIDQALLQSFNGSDAALKGFKIFFLFFCLAIYIGWVSFNIWKEKDPEIRMQQFFLTYGKIFALIISIPIFISLILLLLI